MQLAYDYFNDELFGGRLPSCLITLRTHGKARAYFSAHRFGHLERGDTTHEIAMDARHFANRTTIEVLSTLVHEMVHLRQAEQGKPSRNGYHNREWARMMAEVGLVASDTGQPGGKQTGQAMTHYIEPGGRYELAASELLGSGRFVLSWADRASVEVERGGLGSGKRGRRGPSSPPAKGKSGRRTKFVCPSCSAAAWGRDSLNLVCGDCDQKMVATPTRPASEALRRRRCAETRPPYGAAGRSARSSGNVGCRTQNSLPHGSWRTQKS